MTVGVMGMATMFLGLSVIVFLILDVAMVISLVRPGDERRKMIVWKSGANAFGAAVFLLILAGFRNYFSGYQRIDPILFLSLLAIIYFAQLLYFKRKYGS